MRSTLPKIAFIHIRKTAGSSFLEAIVRNYPAGQQLLLDARPHKLAEARRVLSSFASRPIAFVYGHVGFGITQYLPTEFLGVTILRQPIERVVSQYFFLRERNKSGSDYYKKHSLQYALADPTVSHLFTNVQTRVLSSEDFHISEKPASEMNESDLAAALRNLDRLAFVGFTEDFDRTLVSFSAKFKMNIRRVDPRNVNPAKPSLKDLPAQTRRLLARANELDAELYSAARKRADTHALRQRALRR